MSVPITPWPNVISINVPNVIQIGEIPGFAGNIQTNSANGFMAGNIGGDAFFYTDTGNDYYGQHQFFGVRVKKDGTNCRYIRANSSGVFEYNFGYNCFQIGSNSFLAGDSGGSIQQLLIPDTFVDQGLFTVPNVLGIPPPPCGTGQFQEVLYDSINNLVAYVYINQFPENTFFWASIYKLLPQGLVLINSGYIGENGDGITDIFNRSSLNLPPNVYPYYRPDQSALRFSGGWSAYMSMGYTGAWNLGASKASIVQGGNALGCGVPNNQTYVATTDSFNFSYDRAPANVAYLYNSRLNSYSENNNIFVTNAGGGSSLFEGYCMLVFSKAFVAQIHGLPVPLKCISLLKDGTFIGLGDPTPGGRWEDSIPIYSFSIDFVSYGLTFPAIVTQSQGQLINFSRPVSTNRSFIT